MKWIVRKVFMLCMQSYWINCNTFKVIKYHFISVLYMASSVDSVSVLLSYYFSLAGATLCVCDTTNILYRIISYLILHHISYLISYHISYIITYHIYHILSYIISYISYISYHISYHLILYHIISYHIMYHIAYHISYHILYYIISCII
jgi:hypothetical protein